MSLNFRLFDFEFVFDVFLDFVVESNSDFLLDFIQNLLMRYDILKYTTQTKRVQFFYNFDFYERK